jgi:cytosine/uracil/thiamine/allantoin permease
LVETRADGTAPFEVFLASFATLDDLFAGVTSTPTDFTQIAISPDFQIAGLTWDGSAYRVLVETRADGTAPFEVFLASFTTLADLFAGTTVAPTDFTQIAISPDYQIADLTWDGSAYRVMVETRADGTAPFEVFLASFATLDDLFAGTTGALTDFTQIAISPDYQIAGFSSVTTETSPPGSVPEPASLCLILVGLGAARFTMRRR